MSHLRSLALSVAAAAALAAFGLWPAGTAAAGSGSQAPAPAAAQAPDALTRLAGEISAEVAALRGWPFKSPVVKRRTTPEDARRYIARRTEALMPPDRLAVQQAMLATLGLIPPGLDLKTTLLGLLESQVGGYYDPETRTLYLVDRDGGMPAVAERLILAHELTHALDDQYVDLERFLAGLSNRSEDLDLVAASLTEGSATGLMVQYLARLQASGRLDMAGLQAYAQTEMERSRPLLDAPPYFSVLVASYVCGMQFLARGDIMALALAPDNAAFGESFLAAVKNPPRSTEQILHPAKYWQPSSIDEPVVVSDESVARWIGEGTTRIVHADTLGELLTAIVVGPRDRKLDPLRMQLPGAWTSPAAEGWGGDRFFLLAEGSSVDAARRRLNDRLRGVWITAWDTVADRDEWLAALPGGSLPASAAPSPLGDRAGLVFIGFEAAERLALLDRLADFPVTFSRDGAPWPALKPPVTQTAER